MQAPLISVIVPVYKTEAFLRKCLDSIIHQTYRNLEIICVDDGSPDKCGEILDEYARLDSRVKVIHRPNGGLSAARNSGLTLATGDWITGVDSDDYLEPDIYRRAVEKLSDEVDILVFGTRIAYETDVAQDVKMDAYFRLGEEGILTAEDPRRRSTNACFWNKLWRRSFLEQHQITFPEGFIHEDEYFYRCLAPLAKGIYVLPHTGYNYLQRMGSIVHSGKTPWQKYMDNLPIIEKTIAFHQSAGTIMQAREYILPFWVGRLNSIVQQQEYYQAQEMNRAIISRHRLMRALSRDFRLFLLQDTPWWKRPFFRLHRPNRCAYMFFGIPLFSVMYEDDLPHHRDSVWLGLIRCICHK